MRGIMTVMKLLQVCLEAAASIITVVVARWLLDMSSPSEDLLWLRTRFPDLAWLRFYRVPEIWHQLRGMKIEQHLTHDKSSGGGDRDIGQS